jgi:tetratricopeptide (TPR) repeat protein
VRELMPLEDRYFSNDYIQVLQAIGDTEAAEKEAQRAAGKWPGALDARVALAELALLRGQPEQVFTVLEGDISGNARALAVRSRAHLLLGNSKAALADIDAALALSAALPEVLTARAEVDLALGDVLAAQARLEPIYSPRAPPRVRTVYAAVLRRQGKFDDARAIVTSLLEVPPSQRAYLELARLERAQGEFAKAREAYEKVLSQAPGSLEARLESALLTYDTGNIKKARAVLEELVAAHPTCSPGLLEAAPLLTLTGAYEQARQVLDQAEKLAWAPRWQIARERGRLALRRGERNAALTALSTARNLQEDDLESRMLLLDAQLKEEDGPGARKTVEDILKHFSRGEAMRDMARARLDLAEDRIEDALKTYRLARALLIKERAAPREIAVTEYWTGRAHFLADRLIDASKSFTSAVKRDPGNADAQFYLGLSSFYLKRWVTVTRAMEATLDVDPVGNPEAWHYLGVAHSSRKRWGDAKKAFKEYLARYPEGYLAEDARAALRRLR